MARIKYHFLFVDMPGTFCEVARMANERTGRGPGKTKTIWKARNGRMPRGPRDAGVEAAIININLDAAKGAEQARLVSKVLTICQQTGWSRSQVVRYMIETPAADVIVREIKQLKGAAAELMAAVQEGETNHADNGG